MANPSKPKGYYIKRGDTLDGIRWQTFAVIGAAGQYGYTTEAGAIAGAQAHANLQRAIGVRGALLAICYRCEDPRVSVIMSGEYKGRHVFEGDVLDTCPAMGIHEMLASIPQTEEQHHG